MDGPPAKRAGVPGERSGFRRARRQDAGAPCASNGVALLLVLGILTLLVALVAALAVDSSRRFAGARDRVERVQAPYALRAGAEQAVFLLRADVAADQRLQQEDGSPPADHPREPWASDAHEVVLGDLVVRIRITDERARLHVGDLVDAQGVVQPSASDRLRRLMRALPWSDRLDPDLQHAALIDWVDRAPDGEAEAGDHEEHARNAPLDTVDELMSIPGLDPLVVSGWAGSEDLERFPGLVDLLTRWSAVSPAPVNVNTAGREVLLSLSDRMTEAKVQSILQVREAAPFRRVEDLTGANVPGLDAGYDPGMTFLGELGPAGANLLAVATDTFRVDLEVVREGRTVARARQVVVRAADEVNEIAWDPDPVVEGR